MQSLYAVSIMGTMLYVEGNLSEEECSNIEKLTKKIQIEHEDLMNYKKACDIFTEAVKSTFNISLIQVPLKYVFRIE